MVTEEDLSGLPVVVVEHSMTDEELEDKFGKDGWKQLPDEVYRRYSFTPAKIEVEEYPTENPRRTAKTHTGCEPYHQSNHKDYRAERPPVGT